MLVLLVSEEVVTPGISDNFRLCGVCSRSKGIMSVEINYVYYEGKHKKVFSSTFS